MWLENEWGHWKKSCDVGSGIKYGLVSPLTITATPLQPTAYTVSSSADCPHVEATLFLFSVYKVLSRAFDKANNQLKIHSSTKFARIPCHPFNMPPKKKEDPKGKRPSAAKVAEDKTFGMKNKKGSVAQKHIKQLEATAKSGGSAEEKRKQAEKDARAREKKAAEDAKRETEALLAKPSQIQKVPFGVDPKTVVCIFWRKGNCEKGRKCKFAHDLAVERKTEKKNLYTDGRAEEEENKKLETSDDWDEEKLRKVVLSKKGNQITSTDKVCKFFIEAIEDGKYGWFWVCPNGGDKCKYKHALPPG